MSSARRCFLGLILGAGLAAIGGCGKRSGLQEPEGTTFPRQMPDPNYVIPKAPASAPASAEPATRPDLEPTTRVFQQRRRRSTRTLGTEPSE